MWLDDRIEFCDATALPTGLNDSVILGDVYDLGKTTNYPGNSSPLFFVVTVDTTVTSGGAGTLVINLASDSTSNLATSRTNHITTSAFAIAAMTAGSVLICQQLPQGAYERYLGVWVANATAALTAGKINAFITTNPENWLAVPDAL